MPDDEEIYFDDNQRPTEIYPSPEQIMMWCQEAQINEQD